MRQGSGGGSSRRSRADGEDSCASKVRPCCSGDGKAVIRAKRRAHFVIGDSFDVCLLNMAPEIVSRDTFCTVVVEEAS